MSFGESRVISTGYHRARRKYSTGCSVKRAFVCPTGQYIWNIIAMKTGRNLSPSFWDTPQQNAPAASSVFGKGRHFTFFGVDTAWTSQSRTGKSSFSFGRILCLRYWRRKERTLSPTLQEEGVTAAMMIFEEATKKKS